MPTKINFHLVVILLSLFGSLVIFSLVPQKIVSQLFFLALGFGFYFYLQKQDPAIFLNLGPFLYLLSLGLLLLTLFFGHNIRGASRWLIIGQFHLQVSELIKPFLILSYANFFRRWPPLNFKNIVINGCLALLPIGLIFIQPDLGTAIVHFLIWFFMLYLAGLPKSYLGLSFVFLGLLIYLTPHFLKPYQLTRLLTFLEPQRDPLGAGYNVIQATITVGSGRLWGRGFGRGTQAKLHFLPERHTDFIFSSLAEEFGFIGVLLLLALFAWLFFNLLKVILLQNNSMYKLILVGTFSYLFFQAGLNMAMNLGIAPVTGVTLPLISYGGSSLLATLISLGVAVSTLNRLHLKPDLEIK